MDKALFGNNPLSYIILTTLSISFISIFSFCSISSASAASRTANASINVPSACTLTTTGTGTYSTTMNPGATKELTGSPLKVSCNDKNGYDLYAIGFSGDSYDTNNTDMLSSLGTSYNIKTNTSGSNSYWAMKVAGSGTNTPTIDNSYSNYKTIPTTYTKISHFTGITTNSITTPTYKVTLSSDQAAGTYTGKVKYTIVHPSGSDAPSSIEMQNLDPSLCTSTPITVFDTRDNTNYRIARLADGKCWMIENLNLAGGTALSADDTDVTIEYIASYTAGNSRLAKYGNTLVLPVSDTAGFSTNNYSYVYNFGNKTDCGASGQNTPCYSYYSWDAATLGSGRTIATENTDAEQSICPKGWRLPTSGASSNNGWKRGDFYTLATAYGANLESNYYESSATFYNNAGPGTVPNFLLAGYYYDGSFYYGGSYGFYWSSTSYSSTSDARNLYFSSSYVRSADIYYRYFGFSVRCLLSD